MTQFSNITTIQDRSSDHTSRHVYTVSEFTCELKEILESKYPFIWIKGEVSNFKEAVSGHLYFTLKDETAQINAVMFRNQNRQLKFEIDNGMMLIGFGRLSLFEPRGTYQVIFEYLEPDGKGAIVVAYEQLKARLNKEGLFKDEFKKPLPFLPKKISIITSPSGSVIFDLVNVISRRYPDIHIEVVPAKVQGEGSEVEIVNGLSMLNERYGSSDAADVIILARGGGSLEDLHAFNSESVARAVFKSTIPVISAIGHETDYTITDFVSDLRASTPSAAGELVVPVKLDLIQRLNELIKYLNSSFFTLFDDLKNQLKLASKRLVNQERKINDIRMRIEDLNLRLHRVLAYIFHQKRDCLYINSKILMKNDPVNRIKIVKEKLEQKNHNLLYFINKKITEKSLQLKELISILNSLNPASILNRGYSITRTVKEKTIIRDPKKVSIGQELEIILAKGKLKVKKIKDVK